MNILAIEDNEADAVLLDRMIRLSGLDTDSDVTQIDSMTQGLVWIAENKPDIIFLDLGLPDSFGCDGVRKVVSAAPHAVVVVLTGHEDEIVALECLSYGAQDYLSKDDLKPEILRKTILFSLERKRAQIG